jgi:hypothetical protein
MELTPVSFYIHRNGNYSPASTWENKLEMVSKDCCDLQKTATRVPAVYLYTRNFQKNKRAEVQTYGDGNPSNKILEQAIVVSTGNEGCSQYVCELEYSV